MKYYGVIGYGESVESFPGSGVYKDIVIERNAYGEVIRNTRQTQENAESMNDNITVNNTISVVMDAYSSTHFFAIRYVSWQGARWKVTNVEVNHPRLLLSLGGVWNGKTPIGSTNTS